MFTLIENGEVYSPEPCGRLSVLLGDDKIVKVGTVDRSALESLDVETQIVDAAGCIVTPGFIDPHQHLLGGSGESGFASQTPPVSMNEILCAGITTVVGCLGADTTTKTPQGLLAKVKGLKEEGLNAFMWTGGYSVPPACITESIKSDIMFIDEVLGVGEIAIADDRSSEPTAEELARLASDTHLSGKLAKKAGVVHIHVGDKPERLEVIRRTLEDKGVKPEWFYLTHVTRSDELMLEAIELAKRGSFVDIDAVDEDFAGKLTFYLDNGGPAGQLTLSSDASITSPKNVFGQIRSSVLEHGFAIEDVLPIVASNTANVLKLEKKGRLEVGKIADVLVIEKRSFELRDLFSKGCRLIKDGEPVRKEKFLEESNRTIVLKGEATAGKA